MPSSAAKTLAWRAAMTARSTARRIAQQVPRRGARRGRGLGRGRGPRAARAWRPSLVGDDRGDRAVYVGGKQKASAEVGIRGFDHRLAADAPHDEVRALLHELNADPAVNGILLQLPTPPQVDGPALTAEIDPAKDVDGLTPISTGLLVKGLPGPAPVHAERRDGAAAPPRRRTSKAPRRSSSAAPTSSASRSPRCCWPPTRPSPPPLAHARPRRRLPPRGRPGRRGRRPAS